MRGVTISTPSMPRMTRRKQANQQAAKARANGWARTPVITPRITPERVTDSRNQTILARKMTRYINVAASPQAQSFSNHFVLNLVDATTVGSLQNLFDQFRVLEVTVEWTPRVTEFVATGGTSLTIASAPFIHSVLDFDDAVLPTSLAQMQAYSTYKFTNSCQRHSRTFVPTVRNEVSTNGDTTAERTAFQPIQKPWIDIASPGTQFLGSKWFVDPVTGGGTSVLGVFTISGIVEFRQNR